MNESALRQIDVLIKHGARIPLCDYVELREKAGRGSVLDVLRREEYIYVITIRGPKSKKARIYTYITIVNPEGLSRELAKIAEQYP